MNSFKNKTSFKVLTLYIGKGETYQFRNVDNFKIVTTDSREGIEDGLAVDGKYLSFDYVSQATGEKNHAVLDCFGLFGVSYEVD